LKPAGSAGPQAAGDVVVIVDTTVWVDYLGGVSTPEFEWFEREVVRQRLGLLDLMLCEVLQGLSTDDEAARILRHLRRSEVFETGGVDLPTAAASNYRRGRARGKTVRKTIDCLIATFCLEHDHALLHCDRDFDAFDQFIELRVVHPGSPGEQ
jgi:predicted nucleic acid-binding protein